MSSYFVLFEKTLLKHCSSELEVQIRGGDITSDGQIMLKQLQIDYDILQYELRISEIVRSLSRNAAKRSRIRELLCIVEDDIVEIWPDLVHNIQKKALKMRRRLNNKLCQEKCSTGPSIHNFTQVQIPSALFELLKSSLSNVPLLKPVHKELKAELESEALKACEKVFYDEFGTYPRMSSNRSLTSSVLEIISQCKSNSTIISDLINFRDEFLENLPFFLKTLPRDGLSAKDIVNLVPAGCIVSPSDKNIGVSILPPDWFAKEYRTQVLKGGYELINMNEEECLALLLRKISAFQNQCSEFQKKMLLKFMPKTPIVKPRIGVLKLVPKIHKLVEAIDEDSWKVLKSRPIRGAENDPMKNSSKALYSLLKQMLQDFSIVFPSLDNHQKNPFPVLAGCDDYLKRLELLELDPRKVLKTCLITADFSDAYTETGVDTLKVSISTVGKKIGYTQDHIGLMQGLVELVFSNCNFFTPYGLYRQSKGMPMGDYSSRDALDVELVCSEHEIIKKVCGFSLNVHLYCRLVDDVSVIVQGPFPEVKKVLQMMGSGYPNHMPLNCQLSFGYMRFLDLHVNNLRDPQKSSSFYKLTHSLAYKEHSSFGYTSSSSNIHPRYKHAIVPIGLHRIHTRCSHPADKNHHLKFLQTILPCRNQDPVQVRLKTHRFFINKTNLKKTTLHLKKPIFDQCRRSTTIKFDNASRRHGFMKAMIRKSFGSRLMILYKSSQSIGSIVCPKRAIIRQLSLLLNKK